jgi:SAM-dependent methyltransferase
MRQKGKAPDRSLPPPVSRPSYPTGLSAGTGAASSRAPTAPPPPGVQVTPDFSQIDFERLWAGRGRVTEVEGAILARALAREPPGRGLELGAGGGRLTPYFRAWSPDIVEVDATVSLLWRPTPVSPVEERRVGANVYHLPFASETFVAATLVRVFGFLTDPGAALREIHRVLRPRGVLLLSFEPHPSLGTLVDDLKVGLGPASDGPFSPMTFSGENVVPVRPSAYPAWSHTRKNLQRLAVLAGFSLEIEYPCGLEDLRGFRWLPASVFLCLSKALSRLGGFPTRFLLLRKSTLPPISAERMGHRTGPRSVPSPTTIET